MSAKIHETDNFSINLTWAAGEALWSQISVIRDKSNTIGNMEKIPVDYCLDVYWE